MDDLDNFEISSDLESNGQQKKESQNSDNEEEDVYFVEKILDKKIVNGVCKYKVKWQGWSEKDCTWEPLENLENVADLISDYEDRISGKKRDFMEEANEVEKKSPEVISKKSPEKAPEQKEKVDLEEDKVDLEEDEEELIVAEIQSDKSQGETKQAEPSTKKAAEKGKQRGKRNLPDEGSLRYKDEPKTIISVRPTKEPGKLIFQVEWNARSNGTMPLTSYVSNHEFRRLNPRFLLDYYESKLNLTPKKKMEGSERVSSIEASTRVQSVAASDKSKLVANSLAKNIEPEKNKKEMNGFKK